MFCILTKILSFITRAKYHKLKYGTELNQGEVKMPSFESGKRIQPTFENVYMNYHSKVLGLVKKVKKVCNEIITCLF